jgi:hypothetical protein
MTADYFVYALMTLNAGACLWYGYEGQYVKSLYWLCVIGLNWSLVRMK